jgi:4-amino-4-deoxy-L-arabinose transferase-like glycosyltransferase
MAVTTGSWLGPDRILSKLGGQRTAEIEPSLAETGPQDQPARWMKHSRFLVMLLAVAAILVYCTYLHYAPIYLAHDEVIYALTARSIALTARDLNGEFLPALFHIMSRYGSYYVTPMVIYITAVFLKFLPFTESVIRMPSALIGVLDVVLMYFAAGRIFQRESLAFFAAAMLVLTPAHFIHARFASDLIYPLPFALGWLLCLVTFIDQDRPWVLFAATSLLGVGMFSYLASVGTMSLFAGLTAVGLALYKKPLRAYGVAAAGYAWPLAALLVWFITHPAQYAEIVRLYPVYESTGVNPVRAFLRTFSYFSTSVRINTYYEFFNPSFLFFSGDSSILSSTRQAGVLLFPLGALIPIGVYRIVKDRRAPIRYLLIAGFLIAPLPAALLLEVTIHRALLMLPFGALVATCGLEWLLVQQQRRWRVAAICLLLFLPLQFIPFYLDYMGAYRSRSSAWFEKNMRRTFEQLIPRERPGDTTPVYLCDNVRWIDSYWNLYLVKSRREDLLARTVYVSPQQLDAAAMPAGTVVVSKAADPVVNGFMKSGSLHKVATISELDGTPSFLITER